MLKSMRVGDEAEQETIEIKFKKRHNDSKTASLDRIDSSKGYTEDNIQWVHKDVNQMKMDLPEQRFF